MRKWKLRRVKPEVLGYSRSWLKTLLKRHGFNIRRDFYGFGSMCFDNGSYNYRIRTQNTQSGRPEVDISCHKQDFDRWANSLEETVTLSLFVQRLTMI
jgi:hypothetical protein